MKRTTIAFEDAVLKALKQRALDEGRSVQAIVNEAVKRALTLQRRVRFKLKLPKLRFEIPAGIDVCDRDSLYDWFDGRGGEK